MEIKAAIFDFDGTLADSMFIWDEAGEKYLQRLGITAEKNLKQTLRTMSLQEGAQHLKQRYGLELSRAEIIAGVNQTIAGFYRKEIVLKPGAKTLLHRLHEQDIPMCIATATDRHLVETALYHLKVRQYFARIFTCSEVGVGKTQADIFLQAATFLGRSPAEIAVFEDSLHALLTAKKAGFQVIGVYDSSEPDPQKMRAYSDLYLKSIDKFLEH